MVRQNLCCDDPVEVTYYSSECFDSINVCTVHVQCSVVLEVDCQKDGKKLVFRRKRKLTK